MCASEGATKPSISSVISSIDTLRWLAGSTDTGRATCSTLAITVSTWLAPVRRTVSGRAASEQTWIMADLFGDYRRCRRVGKGASRRAHHLAVAHLVRFGGHASLCPPY